MKTQWRHSISPTPMELTRNSPNDYRHNLLSTYCLPGTVLGAVPSIFPAKLDYCVHLTEEESEAHTCEGSQSQPLGQDLNSGPSAHLLSNAPRKVSVTLSV